MTREEMEELNGLAASMGLYDDKHPCKRAVILGKAIKELEREPCEQPDKAVSLNSVIKLTCEECPEDYKEEWCKGEDRTNCVFIDRLKEIPPVTPAVKIGKWIQEGGKLPYCSKCGAYSDDADRGIYFKDKGESVNEEARFCPNCGSYNGGKE